MKFLDSNILIYAGEARFSQLLLPFVTNTNNFVSIVSHVETLGYHRITAAQIVYFENVFKILQTIKIDDAIIHRAIQLRQLKSISLGDSLIAATALAHGLELISRNSTDFAGIPGLVVINPIP